MVNGITFNFLIYFVQKLSFSRTLDKFNLLFYLPSSLPLSPLVLHFLQLRQGDRIQILKEAVVFDPLFHLRP